MNILILCVLPAGLVLIVGLSLVFCARQSWIEWERRSK